MLFGMLFVESGLIVGFLLPGDSILFAAGLLAAEPGSGLSVVVLAVGSFTAATVGNLVGYGTGQRFGRPWLLRRAGRASRHVERAEQFYERYGWSAVVAARFVPWARTFTPVLAGVARMTWPRFVGATVAGAALWGAGLVTLGFAAHTVPWLRTVAYLVAGVAVAGSVVAPLTGYVLRRRAQGRADTPPADTPHADTPHADTPPA